KNTSTYQYEIVVPIVNIDNHPEDEWLRFFVTGSDLNDDKRFGAFVDISVQEYQSTREIDDIFADFTPSP
ncbi:MAG: hypothetical protein ACK2T7_10165, partial [Anaerolineales bacterium]